MHKGHATNSVVANTQLVANAAPVVVANKRTADRHADKEARRIYQRELMRKRRLGRNPD